jgi:hypothetical protein
MTTPDTNWTEIAKRVLARSQAGPVTLGLSRADAFELMCLLDQSAEDSRHRASVATPEEAEVTYYKWLNNDLTTTYQDYPWPVRVGAWTPAETPVLCESGWHATTAEHLIDHLPNGPATLWEVHVKGPSDEGHNKFAVTQMKLVRRVGVTDAKLLRLFACDVAEDVLPIFWKVSPNDMRPRDAILVARRFANGEATSEERDAARAAAWDAAGDAARAAARAAARDAARAAARAAAWAAAEAAARDAAGAAAGDAARDAARAAAWDAAGDAAEAAARAAARAAAGDAAGDAAEAAAGAKYSLWLLNRIENS